MEANSSDDRVASMVLVSTNHNDVLVVPPYCTETENNPRRYRIQPAVCHLVVPSVLYVSYGTEFDQSNDYRWNPTMRVE